MKYLLLGDEDKTLFIEDDEQLFSIKYDSKSGIWHPGNKLEEYNNKLSDIKRYFVSFRKKIPANIVRGTVKNRINTELNKSRFSLFTGVIFISLVFFRSISKSFPEAAGGKVLFLFSIPKAE